MSRVQQSVVAGTLADDEVEIPVVRTVLVDMMNRMLHRQRPAEGPLSGDDVLEDVPVLVRPRMVG